MIHFRADNIIFLDENGINHEHNAALAWLVRWDCLERTEMRLGWHLEASQRVRVILPAPVPVSYVLHTVVHFVQGFPHSNNRIMEINDCLVGISGHWVLRLKARRWRSWPIVRRSTSAQIILAYEGLSVDGEAVFVVALV